jgi:filamentous hemagglutinin
MDALGSAWTATDTMLGTAANGVTNFVSNGLGYFGRVIAAGFGAAVAQNCFEAGTLVAMCDGGQQPIETLREGDQVASMADDGSIECRAITKTFERIAEDRATVVVDSDKGTDALHTTLGHRFWVENRGWVSVHEIAAGDFLRSEAGSASSVRSVDVESGAARVFNLEVAQNHTYFVGASRALAHNTCGDAAEGATYAEGSFSVIDWTGYPEGMPRPDGALRVLSGDEYAAARALANETNAGIRAANGLEGSGLQIHEIQPVKFGGSPTDMANKMLLPTAEHIGPDGVHPQFWQPLLQWVTGGGG